MPYLAAVCASISIHALREEGDFGRGGGKQSMADFYPRPPRGGRPERDRKQSEIIKISIHALREEGDQHGAAVGVKYYVFLSTPSARRATRRPSLPPGRLSDFYPRPPRGGRPSGR